MPETNLKFHSAHGKRQLLVVEDEVINREILGMILEELYEPIYAETGAEALAKAHAYADTLSLVLLDLNLPDMHGLDVLRQFKGNDQLSRLPVIVMTAEKDAEVESLNIGAIDFIPKPYPQPKVILARINRTIELSEDRDIIRWTERDHLTHLYNRDYFYHYADQFDTHHRNLSMDAIVVDVNHFHMINERYGKPYGDEVLRRIAGRLQQAVREDGGIVCRRENDTFLVYCPHRGDYADLLDSVSVGLAGDGQSDGRIRLRLGAYPDVDKTIDIERRFDRAKLAADTVRNNYTKAIALYNDALRETELFLEQLLEDFETAISEHQFQVYYQPKFDIRPVVPILSSAEALIRWKHPKLGMVSPGSFIPLFENNGLIQRLDSYVWREAARQIREWKDRLEDYVPVSVNVSRVDMFDPDIVQNLKNLIAEFGLSCSDLLLEITESAYTQDSEQVIETVHELREAGFLIEMDDFGSGYSSLNMISTLPIDALKLDMYFIRTAFREKKNTRMLEIAIDIAGSLSVPTIAEGVETAEQMFALKAMGCDIVQGYYFSRPVPAEEFEPFLLRHKAALEAAQQNTSAPANLTGHAQAPGSLQADMHDPLTGLYNANAFEMLLNGSDNSRTTVMVVGIDDLQSLKDSGDQSIHDRILSVIADVLRSTFRSVDFICRIPEDEYAILLNRVDSSMRSLIFDKLDLINAKLKRSDTSLPPVSLSVGVAFPDRQNPSGSLVEDAAAALHQMQADNRCGCAIY